MARSKKQMLQMSDTDVVKVYCCFGRDAKMAEAIIKERAAKQGISLNQFVDNIWDAEDFEEALLDYRVSDSWGTA